jgi:release factor glutamine methyltransferase
MMAGRPARRSAAVADLLDWASRRIAPATASPRLDAELLLAGIAGLARSSIMAFPERLIAAEAARRFRSAVRRRLQGVPVAYLVGTKEFFSLPIAVTPAVLIPRPETELAVEEALTQLPQSESARVLDLGTGSGAIALALARARGNLTVTGIDSSPAALAVAKQNARSLDVRVRWLQSDWFEALGEERFELIVANPPYVESDDPALARELRHEPRLALDGGPDGLRAIETILAGARRHLADRGRLLIEHGASQKAAVERLALRYGLTALVARRDLSGHDRLWVLSGP